MGRSGTNLSKETPASVYVMRIGERCKIGIATNPLKRQREITTATGLAVELVTSRVFSTRLSAAAVERKLHKRFNRWRQFGEWFAMPAERAVAALDGAADPEHHIKGWTPDMPPEVLDSALERFIWTRAKKRGETYVPGPRGIHPSDLNEDGSVKAFARDFYTDADLEAHRKSRFAPITGETNA